MSKLEGKIDFEGQKLTELICQTTVVTGAVLGFFIGFYYQSLSTTLMIFGGGVALAALLTLPAWPFYNRHPIQWLPKTKE